jgi:hypothetical protein
VIRILILFLAASVAGCASRPVRPEPTQLPGSERTLKNISIFIAAIAQAETVTVYEGLPHQSFDQDAYAIEVKRADLVWLEEFPFYAKPLEIPEAEKKTLTAIAGRATAHVPFGGYKLCGGYHPDYAVVWTGRDGKKSGSLICFGCHEWKNFTPAGRLYEDLEKTAYDELRAILLKYAEQRPQRKAQ